MTNLRGVYHCSICGNVIEVVNTGAYSLVCCDIPMNKLEGEAVEKFHKYPAF